MKPFVRFAVVGVSSVILFKLFATIILPMMALLFGLLALTVKAALIAAVAFFLYTLVRRKDREVEIVVEEVD